MYIQIRVNCLKCENFFDEKSVEYEIESEHHKYLSERHKKERKKNIRKEDEERKKNQLNDK